MAIGTQKRKESKKGAKRESMREKKKEVNDAS
jgi:hypothetical protein